jgi:hypothetical protein
MSLSFPILYSDSLSIICLLTPADWSMDVSVSHLFAARVTSGLSDREDRVPEAEQMLLTAFCGISAEGSEAQALRNMLATLGTGWVGYPLWMDQFSGDSAPKCYAAQRIIDLTAPAILAAGATLDSSHTYAPLLVGHITELPPIRPSDGDDAATCEFTVTEDSPWDFRIGPAVSMEIGTWPTALSPDWSDAPVETPVRELEFERIGYLRQQVIGQQERALRWTSKAGFTMLSGEEIGTLIGFYSACRGPWKPFDSAFWYTPGDPTQNAPHSSMVRFDDEALVISYVDTESATAEIKLIEVPWEIAGVSGETPQQPPRLYLYRFTYAIPEPVTFRFTNCWRPMTVTGDGIYTPAPMEHEDMNSGLTLTTEDVTLNSFESPGNPLAMFNPNVLEGKLELRIYEIETEPIDPDQQKLVWAGTVTRAPKTGRRYSAEGKFLGGLIDREGPMVRIGPSCNTDFCSNECGHDLAAFKKIGTLATASGTTVVVSADDTETENTYAPGCICVGTGLAWETRTVIASAPVTGGQQFTLDRPLRQAASGQTVTYYRICDRSVAVCKALDPDGWKARFRGHPNLPVYSLSLPTAESSNSGKK